MEIDIAGKWLTLVLAFGMAIWNVRLHFAGARKEQLDKLEDRIKTVETENATLREKVSQIDTILKQLPDRDSVHDLALKLSEIAGDMKAMRERVNAIGNTTERMDQYLITAGQRP
jgi:predicted nuclease with TOPRIM domain